MDSVGRNRVSLPFFAPLFCLFFLGCFSLLLRLCTLFFAFFQRLRALRVAHASGAGSPPSRPCLSPFLSRLHAFTLPHARRVCARMHMHPVQPSAPRAPGCAHVHIRMSSSLRSPWAKTACSSVAPGAASKSHSADVRANWAARTGARRWALWWAVSASCSAGTSRPFSKSTAAVLAVRCVRPLCLSLRQLPPLLFPASLPLSPLVSAWCGRLLCLSLQKLLLPPSRPPPPPPSFYLLSSLSPRFESTVDDGWAWQVRVLNEQFIELFDTDLVTIDQSRRPSWL